jgi:hypothetical protein
MNPREGLYAKNLAELRSLSDEQLREKHDSIATGSVGVEYYRNELNRRTMKRQGQTMLRLTYVIAALTVVNLMRAPESLAEPHFCRIRAIPCPRWPSP